MSIIQVVAFIVLIALVGFVIFGLWLKFRIRKYQDENDTEHVKRLRKWIKENPERAEELGYIRKERNDATE
ncbi:MAG: hypothetical protein IKM79_06945 [Bacteroidales bacterium]|nr:hypothetical protein [Bacteroidales bacterium]